MSVNLTTLNLDLRRSNLCRAHLSYLRVLFASHGVAGIQTLEHSFDLLVRPICKLPMQFCRYNMIMRAVFKAQMVREDTDRGKYPDYEI